MPDRSENTFVVLQVINSVLVKEMCEPLRIDFNFVASALSCSIIRGTISTSSWILLTSCENETGCKTNIKHTELRRPWMKKASMDARL